MSDMIDRIARIVDYAAFASLAILDGKERSARQERARIKAREILGVMEEATDEMYDAGWLVSRHYKPFCKREVSESVWQAMLTAALEDGPDGERG